MIQFSQKCTLEENEHETNETDFIKKHFKNALENKENPERINGSCLF